MGKPYSMDLRKRAVAAVLESGLSRRAVAARFDLGIRVINWVRRFQTTGSVAPGQMGGQKPKAIRGEYEVFVLQRLGEGDFTLRGSELAERGLSVWNFVHAQNLSFKKNRARQRAGSSRRRPPADAVEAIPKPN